MIRGRIRADTTVLFLPRHGRGHRAPSARHQLPRERLRPEEARRDAPPQRQRGRLDAGGIAPGDFVVVDQFIDLTKRRASTFFDADVAAHVVFADPVCPTCTPRSSRRRRSRRRAPAPPGNGAEGAPRRDVRVHRGPAVLDARREPPVPLVGRLRHRHDGMPEAKLAREAELPYATARARRPTTTAGTRARRR